MSIYRIATPPDAAENVHAAYAPSEGAARAARRELSEAHGHKLLEITIAPIDLLPGKAGLIAYLNAFHAEAPASYVLTRYPKAAAKKPKKKKSKK